MTSIIKCKLVFLLILCAIIIPPVSSVTLSPGSSFDGAPAIANGDPVYIHGIATGQPSGGLQIWLIGKNYVKITAVSPKADNTYEFELKSADTLTLTPGQYFVLIQHPMMNSEFDIYYDSSTGSVINRQLGTGSSIFQLTGPGSLQRPDAGYALMEAINSQTIDDTFAITSFIVGNPTSIISPVGDHYVGDKFTITGFTNLAVGNDILVEIYSSSFKPTQKEQSGEFSGSSGTVTVMPGTNGYNTWSFDVDTATFKSDEYIIKISGITNEVTASATFNILEALPPAPVQTVKTQAAPLQTAFPIAAVPSPFPTQTAATQSPLSVIWVITGLFVLCIARRTGKI